MTVLEVLISMMVLGIGVLGFAPLLVLSIDSNQAGKGYTEASKLASEKIEQYEAAGVSGTFPITLSESKVLGVYDRFTAITDQASDTSIPSGLCRVEVVVQWTDNRGIFRTTQHVTLVEKVT